MAYPGVPYTQMGQYGPKREEKPKTSFLIGLKNLTRPPDAHVHFLRKYSCLTK